MVAQRLEKTAEVLFQKQIQECETERGSRETARHLPCFEADALSLARTLFRKLFLH
jgi:hypothetical protein